jgi:hypothetical protein
LIFSFLLCPPAPLELVEGATAVEPTPIKNSRREAAPQFLLFIFYFLFSSAAAVQ